MTTTAITHSAITRTARPVLDLTVRVLTRPGGQVQLGWDPERAVLVQASRSSDAQPLAELLNGLDGSRTVAELGEAAAHAGLTEPELHRLLDELDHAGMLTVTGRPSAANPVPVHVHGQGPLSDAVADALALAGHPPSRSTRWPGLPRGWTRTAGVVVLADTLVADPCLAAELVQAQVAHLSVRLRDGRGLVGPLVLPGRTSCLRCADLHRTDRDQHWPALAAQLHGQAGHGSPAAVRATAGVALGQLEHLTEPATAATGPPPTLGATITVDVHRAETTRRVWRPHPDCPCGAHE
ncbi:TOMM precursor leader peptide-binding protein [Rhodococcus sp. X156]|uniref:TOMM precursor leader peptide-binding protein n=1 Tax=Rhodococcus sp. X156 TaxID=2499145 RepID=UPI000FDB78D6|nr:TOMM precursor leader peptide-binding protein [Rhodococcus sp. X156]